MSTQGRNSRTAVALGLLCTIIVAAAIPSLWIRLDGAELPPASPAAQDEPHRSPIALALNSDGTRLLVANQTAGSVSLVDTASGKVLHELATGDKPAGVAISGDGTRGVVTHWFGYDLALVKIDHDRMTITGRVEVGPEPRGVVLDQGGKTAFVAVGAANEVAKVDLETRRVSARVAVGREPRGLALSPDGSILLVGNARSQEVSVISTQSLGVFRLLTDLTIPELPGSGWLAAEPEATPQTHRLRPWGFPTVNPSHPSVFPDHRIQRITVEFGEKSRHKSFNRTSTRSP